MPITFGMKGSSYLCSQITGVESAVPLHIKIFLNSLIRNTCTTVLLELTAHQYQLSLDGFSNCAAVPALDFDTSVS
jgi:hypothetical protein